MLVRYRAIEYPFCTVRVSAKAAKLSGVLPVLDIIVACALSLDQKLSFGR
jgi:hypothetical protein